MDSVKRLMKYVLKKLEDDDTEEFGKDYKIAPEDILLDFEFFASDIYEAKLKRKEGAVKLEFENGQKFSVNIMEEK